MGCGSSSSTSTSTRTHHNNVDGDDIETLRRHLAEVTDEVVFLEQKLQATERLHAAEGEQLRQVNADLRLRLAATLTHPTQSSSTGGEEKSKEGSFAAVLPEANPAAGTTLSHPSMAALLQEVSCPVCLEVYDDRDRTPVTFHCGHSCCLAHVAALDGRCPKCRANIPHADNCSPSYALRGAASMLATIGGAVERNAKRRAASGLPEDVVGDDEANDDRGEDDSDLVSMRAVSRIFSTRAQSSIVLEEPHTTAAEELARARAQLAALQAEYHEAH